MVTPTQKNKKVLKPKVNLADIRLKIISSIKTSTQFRDKALLNTANRWALRNGFKGDLTYKGISDTKKSFHLAVDGKQLSSKYVAMGTLEKPFFVSGRAIAFASRS